MISQKIEDMKTNYLKTLQEIDVYPKHELTAIKIKTLPPETFVPYNREKRRNGSNWMEIYLENDKKAYIKREDNTFFKCEKVTLDDQSALGFKYTQKLTPPLPFKELFFPKGGSHHIESLVETVQLKSIEDSTENKMISLDLEYPTKLIETERVFFSKDEEFYITNKFLPFIEVDNLKGKKGLLLEKTKTSSLYGKWMGYIAVSIAIIVVIAIFLGFLANGWFVISGLMVIVGFIVAIIAVVMIQILLMSLKGLFDYIRKHF